MFTLLIDYTISNESYLRSTLCCALKCNDAMFFSQPRRPFISLLYDLEFSLFKRVVHILLVWCNINRHSVESEREINKTLVWITRVRRMEWWCTSHRQKCVKTIFKITFIKKVLVEIYFPDMCKYTANTYTINVTVYYTVLRNFIFNKL